MIDEEVLYADYPRLESATIPAYVGVLADEVAALARERNGYVLEIGCNNGSFLAAVRAAGAATILGIDAAANCAAATRSRGIPCLQAYFDHALASRLRTEHTAPAVVICRHVLEHLDRPHDFLVAIDSLLDSQSQVILEVPDLQAALDLGDFTSFTEQHLSYFTRSTLERLLQSVGWQTATWRIVPNNWSPALLVCCSGPGGASPSNTQPAAFPAPDPAAFVRSRERLEAAICCLGATFTLALAGAFCRSANLIGFTPGLSGREFVCAVDDDPSKLGKRLPGTPLIVAPFTELAARGVDVCVIGAVGYEERILDRHLPFLEAGGAFLQLFPLGLHVAAVHQDRFAAVCHRAQPPIPIILC